MKIVKIICKGVFCSILLFIYIIGIIAVTEWIVYGEAIIP